MATGLLAVMAVLFVLASLATSRWAGAAYLRAFAEAAMVGGCADWFAVTALFRRPLGLPIPHTAIVPRSKERIGAALGRFIVENFLSPELLDAKLRELELATWGGAWLEQPANARLVADRALIFGPVLLRASPPGALEELAGAAALAAVRSVPAAPAAATLLAAAWDEGRSEPLVERALILLGDYLSEHQELILEKVQAQSWRWLPAWVDRAIARKITQGLAQLLSDVRAPDHPWRLKLGDGVQTLITRLATDPDLRAKGEALKLQLLEDPRLGAYAHRLWSELEARLKSGWADDRPTGDHGAARERIEHLVVKLGGWLRNDAAVQRTLNAAARSLARSLLVPRRQEIGRFVAQVVDGWDARAVVERLELQVGPDLQYVRISGALVGGLVGLAIYVASRLLRLG